ATRYSALAACLSVGVAASHCSSPKSVALPAPAAPTRTPMKAVVSVKELMRYTIDPLADNIFDVVTNSATKKGVIETFPKTDEDWEKVAIGAVTLAEGIYLLKIPRLYA